MPISLDPDHTEIAHRRRVSAPAVVTFAMAVVGLLLATGTLWIRATYGVWTIAEAPTRIELCHQSYTRFDDQPGTLDEATAHDASAGGALIIESTVGRLPVGLREPDRFAEGAGYNGCGSLLLLRVGPDAYVAYYKRGGP